MMKNFNYLTLLSLSGFFCLSLNVPAFGGAIANFDSLSEGTSGLSITDNGIVFSDFIAGFTIAPPELAILSNDQLTSPFSPPNYLSSQGSISEVDTDLGAFGSMRISTGNLADSVSLDLFTSDSFTQYDSIIVLDAYLDGTLVGSTSKALSEFTPTQGVLHQNLSLSGLLFDDLQLYTPDAFADGVVALGIDNVEINNSAILEDDTTVPEPLTLLGTATVALFGLFSKQKSTQRRK